MKPAVTLLALALATCEPMRFGLHLDVHTSGNPAWTTAWDKVNPCLLLDPDSGARQGRFEHELETTNGLVVDENRRLTYDTQCYLRL